MHSPSPQSRVSDTEHEDGGLSVHRREQAVDHWCKTQTFSVHEVQRLGPFIRGLVFHAVRPLWDDDGVRPCPRHDRTISVRWRLDQETCCMSIPETIAQTTERSERGTMHHWSVQKRLQLSLTDLHSDIANCLMTKVTPSGGLAHEHRRGEKSAVAEHPG